MKQKELISDERAYQEDLYNRLQSPEAMVKQLEAAGINPAQFLSGGSSAIQPMTSPTGAASAPSAHSGSGGGISYQTPQFPGNPLAVAQIADLQASANLKNAQADNEPIRGSLLTQQAELEKWKNVGMPYATEMLATNAMILRVTSEDKINLSSLEVSTAVANLDKIGRQIQELDDKHDLHGLMKQQAINQCSIQVASFVAKLWEAELTKANIQVSNATVALLKEQAIEASVRALNGFADFTIKQPDVWAAMNYDPHFMQLLKNGRGIIGSTLAACVPFVAALYDSDGNFVKGRPLKDYLSGSNSDPKSERNLAKVREHFKGR